MRGKVVVVGHCAAGKSTVVRALRGRGIDAKAVGQEHSMVADLWRRAEPDYLVYLDVTLETVRERRENPNWPEWIYDLQSTRLEAARRHADLVVDTSTAGVNEIVSRIVESLDPG